LDNKYFENKLSMQYAQFTVEYGMISCSGRRNEADDTGLA